MSFIAILSLIFGTWAAVSLIVHFLEARRTREWCAAAAELQLPFHDKNADHLVDRVRGLPFFDRGHSRKFYNVVQASTEDVDILMFDYRYSVGRGKHKRSYHQTISLIESPNLLLPQFKLEPESILHKIGFRDIDFDSHPRFSQKFLLRGQNETQIRNFFDARLLEWFEEHQGISAETSRHQALLYRHQTRCKPDELRAEIATAFEFYQILALRSRTYQAALQLTR